MSRTPPTIAKYALAIPALLAAACSLPRGATIPTDTLPSTVFITAASVTQSVTISGTRTQRFLLQTETDPAGVRMAGLTAFGQKLFELQYTNGELTVSKTLFLPRSLVPENLFADFQLIYWPAATLRGRLGSPNIEILETISERGPQRRFMRAGVVLADIQYSREPGIESNIVFHNPRQGYLMHIEVLDGAIP